MLGRSEIPLTLTSYEDKLRIRLAERKDLFGPHTAWVELLPIRIGSDAVIDSATTAVVSAVDSRVAKDESSSRKAFESYGRAVRLLRAKIQSANGSTDDDFASISLLALFEMLMKMTPRRKEDIFAHYFGLSKALLAHFKASGEMSDLLAAVLCNTWHMTIALPLNAGMPSPFEAAIAAYSPQSSRQLRMTACQTMIRVPRLVVYTRTLRSAQATPQDAERACQLAKALLDRESPKLESELLHRVKVQPTKEAVNRRVIKFSFKYRDSEDFNTAVTYWTTHVWTIDLALTIKDICRQLLDPAEVEHLSKERDRMAVNLLMSWEHAEQFGPFATEWLGKCLLMAWPIPRCKAELSAGVDSRTIKSWLQGKLNGTLRIWKMQDDIDEDLINQTAEQKIGGPLAGFLADLGNAMCRNARQAADSG